MSEIKPTRRITKLRVREVSLVGEGDNPHADVLILKHRIVDTEKDGSTYADPKNEKYPLDDEKEVRAAWSYINMPRNAAMYSADELKTVRANIVAGFKRVVGHEPPSVETAAQKFREVRSGAIAIAKARSEGGVAEMDIEELTEKLNGIEKSLSDTQKENEILKARVGELEGTVETVTKERDTALAEVEKAKAEQPTEDDIFKGMSKAAVEEIKKARKDAEDSRAEVAKIRDEAEENAEVEKVRGTGLAEHEKFGKLIHRVRKGKSTAEDADALLELVAKAKALADGGEKLFVAIGKAAGTGGADCMDEAEVAKKKLDEATDQICKAKPTLTREQAYAEAIDANPKLYDAARKAPAAV